MTTETKKRKRRVKRFDWESIEREYRSGCQSIFAIARQYGCTDAAIHKRAKRQGWSRDLSAAVRKEVRLRLANAAREPARSDPKTQREIVETAADKQMAIIQRHQRKAQSLGDLSDKLDTILAGHIESGDISVNGANVLYDTLLKAATTYQKLVAEERRAYNLDGERDAQNGDTPITDGLMKELDRLRQRTQDTE